jgi:hypothetical protein
LAVLVLQDVREADGPYWVASAYTLINAKVVLHHATVFNDPEMALSQAPTELE